MNTMIKAVVIGAALWAGSAVADFGGHSQGEWQGGWQDNPAAGWRANPPAFDAEWMKHGDWDARLPPAYPGKIDFPGLGDWDVGIEPPRHGGGEVRCAAIGCEDGGADAIIWIGDCNKGPC